MAHSLSVIALSAAIVLATQTPAFAASDKAFIKKAMEGDNAEVQMGKLAEQKGTSPGIKDFGHMLDMDHGMHKQKDVALASSLGVKPTDNVPVAAKLEMHKLEKLSGPKFDHEFAMAMVKDHQKDIGEYDSQTKAKGPTGAFAKDTLPTLHKHLETAQKLATAG